MVGLLQVGGVLKAVAIGGKNLLRAKIGSIPGQFSRGLLAPCTTAVICCLEAVRSHPPRWASLAEAAAIGQSRTFVTTSEAQPIAPITKAMA